MGLGVVVKGVRENKETWLKLARSENMQTIPRILMLFWLCVPVSTAGLERGFSFQTMIDQDTRRRLTTREHMRDDILAHTHREWFNEQLLLVL